MPIITLEYNLEFLDKTSTPTARWSVACTKTSSEDVRQITYLSPYFRVADFECAPKYAGDKAICELENIVSLISQTMREDMVNPAAFITVS